MSCCPRPVPAASAASEHSRSRFCSHVGAPCAARARGGAAASEAAPPAGGAAGHLREPHDGGGSPFRFMKLAVTPALGRHVRRVTCDWDAGGAPVELDRAVNALPYLQLFRNLRELTVRFEPGRGRLGGAHGARDFQYRVLDTVFRCLAGTWSCEAQYQIDEGLGFDALVNIDSGLWPALPSKLPLRIRTLCIDNLGDTDDPRLTDSHAFRAVIDSGVLTTFGGNVSSPPGPLPLVPVAGSRRIRVAGSRRRWPGSFPRLGRLMFRLSIGFTWQRICHYWIKSVLLLWALQQLGNPYKRVGGNGRRHHPYDLRTQLRSCMRPARDKSRHGDKPTPDLKAGTCPPHKHVLDGNGSRHHPRGLSTELRSHTQPVQGKSDQYSDKIPDPKAGTCTPYRGVLDGNDSRHYPHGPSAELQPYTQPVRDQTCRYSSKPIPDLEAGTCTPCILEESLGEETRGAMAHASVGPNDGPRRPDGAPRKTRSMRLVAVERLRSMLPKRKFGTALGEGVKRAAMETRLAVANGLGINSAASEDTARTSRITRTIY